MDKSVVKLGPDDFAEVVRKAPLVSIDLVVKDKQNQILLGWRTNRPAKDSWFVPGARILKNERISKAFERIAKEELGLNLAYENAKLLGVFEHFYDDNFSEDNRFGTHYVVLAHEVTIDETTLSLPNDQHSEYKWFTAEAARENEKIHPNTRVYFEKFC